MNRYEERKKIILNLMKDKTYVPMKEKELAIILQVAKEDREELKAILEELLASKEISISKRGKYSIAEQEIFTGTFSATQHGYGFVTVEGDPEDYYISEKYTLNAMHGDIVEIEALTGKKGRHGFAVQAGGHRREAAIINVVFRANNTIVGTFSKERNHYGFVIPDNQRINRDIFVPVEKSKGAQDGHKVVVEISDFGSEHKSPEGRIIEILGHVNDPGVDILSVVRGYDIPHEFPERVLNQAERVNDFVTEADTAGRTDLRDVMMVTIDSEDAKDLDDAVSVTRDGENYILGVHIADVTNYVQENSALDREALKRGTSVYLVDRVIPMLPHKLSNGICSLNENVDRLALSCIMTINPQGEIIDHEIIESVIKTNRRMSYTAVNAIISSERNEENAAYYDEYAELVPMFYEMKELANILREKRRKNGSIDFDLPETKIILDENGRVKAIKPYERNLATKLIEDFMLAANETVAEHFFWQEMPFVYRTHEKPDPDKIRKLSTFVRNFGQNIRIKDDEVHPKEIQKLLEAIEGRPEEALISRLTLRSMQRAKYSTDCSGHFGLAYRYYCHFTSPIRRYPDLQIHRIIKESIRGRLKGDRIEHYVKILDEAAKQSSLRERVADDAEREVDKLKKAEYMLEHIGEEFDGVISGVTSWGIYVELENTVEGLVHVSSLAGDFYRYNENSYELIGEATGRRFALGESVRIRVNYVDISTKAVDFILAEA